MRMSKIIAIDIDDVLSMHAEAFVEYSNRYYHTNLNVSDYIEHWSKLWSVGHDELENRVGLYHAREIMAHYHPKKDAHNVLKVLQKKYTLIVITSRKSATKDMTATWIEKYFPGIFKEIYYAGIWDKVSDKSINETKAKLCLDLHADYLIDDQLKHCIAAKKVGVQGILFGNYAWNVLPKTDSSIIRCSNWNEVLEFFND
jgi:uncharacterized HAD superfamily protein